MLLYDFLTFLRLIKTQPPSYLYSILVHIFIIPIAALIRYLGQKVKAEN